MSLPCCCASPAHAAGTTHAHSHAHKHTMSTCRTMRSTAAAALYLKLSQRGKPHGWKHTRMNTGTRWHGHYLATASALLPPACAAGVRREKNVAHKMHCSRGHQERHRAMAARCGGGTARYIPKRASRRHALCTLTNRPACSGRRPTARRWVRGQPHSCTRGGALTHSRAALVYLPVPILMIKGRRGPVIA